MDEIVVGIDVGTTKICTLVGRVEDAMSIRILGVGIEPSEGIRKGIVVDVGTASQAIRRSVEKAEHTSGLEITTALVSLAGAHVSSVNSRGAAGIPGGIIDTLDVLRALEQAQAVAIPHDREIIHIIQRGVTVDGQEGVRTPVGMHGFKLEVVLTEQEREMGVAVCDIGGGTTDLAIYVNGDVWHTMVLAVGGNHVTQDIAHGLRLPLSQAEEVKKQQGYAMRSEVGAKEYFSIRPFGEDKDVKINRQDLAHIIEARLEETFGLIMQEIKRSGYDGLLPAGMVLTGGTSALPGINRIASEVLGMPVRNAQPENLSGLVDKLMSPAFSTSVGLLRWATTMRDHDVVVASGNKKRRKRGEKSMNLEAVKNWLGRLLP